MKVLIPTHLHRYTDGVPEVEAEGETLDAVLRDLDARHPGIRFRVIDEQDRIREHMRLVVNRDVVRDLALAMKADDEVRIIAALSGG